MRTLILSFLSLLLLLGCASPQDRAQKQQAEMSLAVEQYGPACTQVGYVKDTDPWRQCVVQQANNNEAKKGGMSGMFSRWASWWRGDKPKVTETSTAAGSPAGK